MEMEGAHFPHTGFPNRKFSQTGIFPNREFSKVRKHPLYRVWACLGGPTCWPPPKPSSGLAQRIKSRCFGQHMDQSLLNLGVAKHICTQKMRTTPNGWSPMPAFSECAEETSGIGRARCVVCGRLAPAHTHTQVLVFGVCVRRV